MKKLNAILMVGAALLLLLTVIGCEGISGPRGETGEKGEKGTAWSATTPDNRYFALAVTNNGLFQHNGAPKLYLAFDGLHANAGDTVVCQRLAEGQSPLVDGVDEGATGWGEKYTVVHLVKVSGSDNLIDSAMVRAAWDANYVYFQLKWTEVANAEYGLEVGDSDNPLKWTKVTAGTHPSIWQSSAQYEDRALMMFEISPVAWFDHDGCYITCHTLDLETNVHHTNAPKELLDMWSWSSERNKYIGYAEDLYTDNSPVLATTYDVGTPCYRVNGADVRFAQYGDSTFFLPRYQHPSDPNFNAPYPFWDWQLTPFVRTASWNVGATIPYYISSIPSGSAADVTAMGRFDEGTGTWTVEFMRTRHTGNGDDAQF